MHDILKAVKTMSYVNCGRHTENRWEYNLHTFYINGQKFEYETGVSIECKSIIKLFFDAVYCILSDAYYGTMSEEDFISEFCYNNNAETYKKGLKVYRDCMETTEKCRQIWGNYFIHNIFDIMQL